MIAAIVNTGALLKVIAASLVIGVGVTTVFAAGVASASGMLEALRRRRSVAAGALAAVTIGCVAVCGAAIVLGLVVMTSKR